MKQGFSLLELSIVLVIIGLITGGIMAGQSMVRAAELRSVMSDIRKFDTAINTFRDKYNALPGDMKNAESYWGTASGGCPTGVGTGTQTCNGDGNGQIGTNSVYDELFRAWQHLGNAGLIEGTFTGVTYSGSSSDFEPGVNAPASRISGGAYVLRSLGYYAGDSNYFAGYYGTYILFGKNTTGWPTQAMLTPSDAYSIDSKMDDGMPGQGRIWTMKGGGAPATTNPNCATTASSSTAQYNLTLSTQECALMFLLGF